MFKMILTNQKNGTRRHNDTISTYFFWFFFPIYSGNVPDTMFLTLEIDFLKAPDVPRHQKICMWKICLLLGSHSSFNLALSFFTHFLSKTRSAFGGLSTSLLSPSGRGQAVFLPPGMRNGRHSFGLKTDLQLTLKPPKMRHRHYMMKRGNVFEFQACFHHRQLPPENKSLAAF